MKGFLSQGGVSAQLFQGSVSLTLAGVIPLMNPIRGVGIRDGIGKCQLKSLQ